jgi:hypothetical protein
MSDPEENEGVIARSTRFSSVSRSDSGRQVRRDRPRSFCDRSWLFLDLRDPWLIGELLEGGHGMQEERPGAGASAQGIAPAVLGVLVNRDV